MRLTRSDDYLVTVKKSTTCLKRWKDIGSKSSYLVPADPQLPSVELQHTTEDDSNGLIVDSVSECGTVSFKVRKEGEKDLWIEIWSEQSKGGIR